MSNPEYFTVMDQVVVYQNLFSEEELSFLIKEIKDSEDFVYEYDKDSTKEANPYCATYVFSIRTEIANILVNKINSKEEFFNNKSRNLFQARKRFINDFSIKKHSSGC